MGKREQQINGLEVVSIRLVKDIPILSDNPVTSPQDAVRLLGSCMCDMDREVVCVINLRTDGIPINCNFASMGAVDWAVAHPREIFKSSILSNAASILMLHNHPSGKPQPSKEDIMLTDRLIRAGEILGIPVLDHIAEKIILASPVREEVPDSGTHPNKLEGIIFATFLVI